MLRRIMPYVLLVLLGTGCAAKQAPLPLAPAVPDDLSTFQAPMLYTPPPEPAPEPLPPPPRPEAANEIRYAWEEGKADQVPVGIGYPTVVRFQPGEVVTNVMDGDRAYLSEGEQQHQPPQGNKNCYYGVRWQWCKGVSESQYVPIEHLVFTATHAGHKQGVVVFTDHRIYYLELKALAKTTTRLISWTYPAPPPKPPKPKLPGILPDPLTPTRYHVGYTLSVPDPVPDWTPLSIFDDGRRMYLLFSPTVLFQEMPLLRGVKETGPFLVNSRQYKNVVIVDQLVPHLELRLGASKEAPVVTVHRGMLSTIDCPGHDQCPIWP